MEHKYCIYKYTNKINGKIYIGQTCRTLEDRAGKNRYCYKRCVLFWKAIQKYGWDNFEPEILLDNLTKEEADKKEIEFISYYNSSNKNYGYNLSLGGSSVNPNQETIEKIRKGLKEYYEDPAHKRCGEKNSMFGRHPSEETRKKLSMAHKGKPFSESHKANLREATKKINIGRHPSEETRKKLSEINKGEKNHFYGKTHSEISKQKMREKKPCKKIIFITLDRKKEIIFDSMHLASKEINIPRSRIKDRCERGYKQGDEYYIYYYEEYNNKNA